MSLRYLNVICFGSRVEFRVSNNKVNFGLSLFRAVRAILRLLRVIAHILWALWVLKWRFPRASRLERHRHIEDWSRKLLQFFGVQLRATPDALVPERVLLVCNHMSWLDAFVIGAAGGVRFISRDDVRDWPLIGGLVLGTGTLLLNRSSKRAAHQLNSEIADQLAAGERLAFFPEGTTTNGKTLLPFRSSLIEGAIQAEACVQPLALRYRTPCGKTSSAPIYADDATFLQSIWRILCAPGGVVAELVILPALPAGGNRRDLAAQAEEAIRTALSMGRDGQPA